jgi:hypothetical protein
MSYFSLPHTITLEGVGFEWSITFEKITSEIEPEKMTNGFMTLKMQTVDQEQGLGPVAFDFFYNDLIRLADYFDHHITQLIQNSWHDSDEFVNIDLDFQVQAMCGDVKSNQEGEFTVRIMLNMGNASDGSSVYTGIEGCIDVVKCHAFVVNLRDFLKAWGR